MDQRQDVSDLSIILTPPPPDASIEALARIALHCPPFEPIHLENLLLDPLTAKDRENLHWYLEEYWKWPYLEFATRGKQVEALLADIGKRLYRAVFEDIGAKDVITHWQRQSGVQCQISIVSDIPRVLSLPWELLHDEQGFLILRSDHPISLVRRLPSSSQSSLLTSFEPPLRVLLVTARPEGAGFVDPRSIARELVDEVQAQVDAGAIELEFLRPPTFKALRTRLTDRKRPIHVLHFDGHGVFDEKRQKQGILLFETDMGNPSPVRADELAKVVQDSEVKFVMLTACQSAVGTMDDVFSSVAARLVQRGVDAVVAMSASVLVATAARYVEAIYRSLAASMPVPMAHERAQLALYADPRRQLLHRRANEEGQPVELRDWWLPHFYQQRPLVLQAGKLQSTREPQPSTISLSRLGGEMPAESYYGFSGRAQELLQLERALMQGKLVVIHGFGGIGKTALAREAADWLTRTKMYDAACFISFEHSGDAAWLLSTLATFLGVYDGHYDPVDKASALARLRPVLQQRRTLIIADNMESILPGGDAPLEAPVQTELWDILIELSSMGAGMLLTSRATAFDDARLGPGSRVAYIELKGLHPEDAYTLANGLFSALKIQRIRVPYGELRDLLEQLDHHPLAIYLVLPALRELSLAQIKADFAALLPTFTDDAATGRNSSLLASLDFSLRRLSEKQQTLLLRLVPFEGGASEENLLAITEIPESEWAELCLTLEQAGLLSVKRVHKTAAVRFLHFHPILIPYLRARLDSTDKVLYERYAGHYYKHAQKLYVEDRSHPQSVRALARLELPNLWRALKILLEAGKLEDAVDMSECIEKFVTYFGLERVRDELLQTIEAIAATVQEGAVLTQLEYSCKSSLCLQAFREGNMRVAAARFTALLERIEAQPEDSALGPGSYEHCVTLTRFASCLKVSGQPLAAEERLREALRIIDILVKQEPEQISFIRQCAAVLSELGSVLGDQGQYTQARTVYEEAVKIDKQLGDLDGQAVTMGQIGFLALKQGNSTEAKENFAAALNLFQSLGEPRRAVETLYYLGIAMYDQEEWDDAERCFRECLRLSEQLGDEGHIARTCTRLALLAERTDRFDEAEGWYKRALKLDEQVHPGSPWHAITLANFAWFLLRAARAGRAPTSRLSESRSCALQALRIEETAYTSSDIWITLGLLADITELTGETEAAREYRRREREAFAAFPGNRHRISQQHGELIAAIVEAAKGNAKARRKVESALPQLEAAHWHIAAATRRIWAGERDWHSLVDHLDTDDALLVLQVLEALADQPSPSSFQVRGEKGNPLQGLKHSEEGQEGTRKVRRIRDTSSLIEVSIESVRINKQNDQRVLILQELGSQELGSKRYLFIWISHAQAYEIATELQGTVLDRPLPLELCKNIVEGVGASIKMAVVSDLSDDQFFAYVVVNAADKEMEFDARPADAIALALYNNVPIFVEKHVMEAAGVTLEDEEKADRETGS